MAKTIKLQLRWFGYDGSMVREDKSVTPTKAKSALYAAGMFVIDFPGVGYDYPFTCFSGAAVSRSAKGIIAKKHLSHSHTHDQTRVEITVAQGGKS